MVTKIETIIVGGGQGGLSTSYFLSQLGLEHVVLEQAGKAGNVWRNDRWDSFTLLTPNWSFRLPGAVYQGKDPEGFMARDEIVTRFEQYVEHFHLPIQYNVRVNSIEQNELSGGYRVNTGDSTLEARNVVIATGLFQKPKTQTISLDIPERITQIHSSEYRNPVSLPDGEILVVGSAQSGCQIAEELYQSGRKVYLSIGSAGRAPRRYREKDVYEWLNLSGFLDRTVDKLPSPKAKFSGNPHVSGKDGGKTLNLHKFARDGVQLLGRMQSIHDNTIYLSSDLKENLIKADKFESEIVKMVDQYVLRTGMSVPEEQLPVFLDGFTQKEITEINLDSTNISTIIWANGYNFDFSLVKLPVCDEDGFPIQNGGVTKFQGLFFVGLPWLNKQKSGLLIGVGENAEFVASVIASRR
ncbi:MAG: NAD(P)-binding domain-containing protein [Anaerolineaceae bacterium]